MAKETRVGQVAAFDEGPDIDALTEGGLAGGEARPFATLRLKTGEVYKLSKQDERFARVAEFIRDFQSRSLSLYVEADPDTREVSLILPSRAKRARRIDKRDQNSLSVIFFLSPSAYFLRTDREGFAEMAELIKGSIKSKTEVMIATDPDTGEVLDVRPMKEGDISCHPNGFSAEWMKMPERFESIMGVRAALASVIDETTANSLFDALKNKSHIPFGNLRECCESRAHEMRRIMEEEHQIACRKVWRYARDIAYPTLKVVAPTGTFYWMYHTAPIVTVNMDSGVTEYRVFDPALFWTETHVSIDTWSGVMRETTGPARQWETSDPDIYYCEPGGTNEQSDYGYDSTECQLAHHRGQQCFMRIQLWFDPSGLRSRLPG